MNNQVINTVIFQIFEQKAKVWDSQIVRVSHFEPFDHIKRKHIDNQK